jgi:16S rRNA (cytosine1402-N4)-methyltransferase
MNIEYCHKSVLTKEVVQYLNPQPHKLYVDVTLGGGGHTRALLEHEPSCSVIAFDWDKHALEAQVPLLEEFAGRLHVIWGNFALSAQLLKKEGIRSVDGIIADIGTSQFQIQQRAGFSFQYDTPLDMRMSPAHQRITAADVINKASEEELRQILWQLGQEPYAKQIVHALVQERKKAPLQTTGQLAALVERVVPWKKRSIHPATQVFQAFRIYVNHELDNLRGFLPSALELLNPNGRLAVISFHSLEDRIVKQFFKGAVQQHKATLVTPKAMVASDEEITQNPSARSAKLRVIAKR